MTLRDGLVLSITLEIYYEQFEFTMKCSDFRVTGILKLFVHKYSMYCWNCTTYTAENTQGCHEEQGEAGAVRGPGHRQDCSLPGHLGLMRLLGGRQTSGALEHFVTRWRSRTCQEQPRQCAEDSSTQQAFI